MYFYHPNGYVSNISNTNGKKNNVAKNQCSYSSVVNNNVYEHFGDTENNVFNVKGNMGLSGRIEADEFCFNDAGQTFCLNKEFLKQNSKLSKKSENSVGQNDMSSIFGKLFGQIMQGASEKEKPIKNILSNVEQKSSKPNDYMMFKGKSAYHTNDRYKYLNGDFYGNFNDVKSCQSKCDNKADCYGYTYFDDSSIKNKNSCYSIGLQKLSNFNEHLEVKPGANTYVLQNKKSTSTLEWGYGCEIRECQIIDNILTSHMYSSTFYHEPDDDIFHELSKVKSVSKESKELYLFVTGYIEVPDDGEYTFSFDGGVCFHFNDVTLINNLENKLLIGTVPLNLNKGYQYQYFIAFNKKQEHISHLLCMYRKEIQLWGK